MFAAFASVRTVACVMTFSRFPATPAERSRFPTREDISARAVFDAHAGHVAFAASARGAFESRSRGVDPFPRPYGTARVVDGVNAERFDVHAGHGIPASSGSRLRRGHDTPAARRPSEDAVGMESALELDVGARSPATDHLDQLDQLDPHEVAVILADDPTRPDETLRKNDETNIHADDTRERDDAAMDEGAGRRASPTTERDRRASLGAEASLNAAVARSEQPAAVSATRASRPSHASLLPRFATPPKTPTRSTSACTPGRGFRTPRAKRIRER